MLSEKEVKEKSLTLLRLDPYKVGQYGGRINMTISTKAGIKAGTRVYQYIDDRGVLYVVPEKLKTSKKSTR